MNHVDRDRGRVVADPLRLVDLVVADVEDRSLLLDQARPSARWLASLLSASTRSMVFHWLPSSRAR
jgi:hypothetical protein